MKLVPLNNQDYVSLAMVVKDSRYGRLLKRKVDSYLTE